MPISASTNYLKITARKVRLVADLIRRKPVLEAEAILRFTPRKASVPMLKLLNSAIASAKNTYKLDPANLYIAKLIVNDGPMQERVYPRSRGRADKILKRTSHITLVLDERSDSKEASEKSKFKNQKSK